MGPTMNEPSDSNKESEPIEDFSHCHVGILKKLDMHSTAELVLFAARRGVIA